MKGKGTVRPVIEQAGEYNTPVFSGVKKRHSIGENRVKMKKKNDDGEGKPNTTKSRKKNQTEEKEKMRQQTLRSTLKQKQMRSTELLANHKEANKEPKTEERRRHKETLDTKERKKSFLKEVEAANAVAAAAAAAFTSHEEKPFESPGRGSSSERKRRSRKDRMPEGPEIKAKERSESREAPEPE